MKFFIIILLIKYVLNEKSHINHIYDVRQFDELEDASNCYNLLCINSYNRRVKNELNNINLKPYDKITLNNPTNDKVFIKCKLKTINYLDLNNEKKMLKALIRTVNKVDEYSFQIKSNFTVAFRINVGFQAELFNLSGLEIEGNCYQWNE